MAFGGKKRKLKDISRNGISRSSLSMERLESRTLLSTLVINDDPSSKVKDSLPFELDESGQTVIESVIEQPRDKDCYVFTADRSGLMSISMEAADSGRGSGLDSVLFAYDSKRKKIASNDDAVYRDDNSIVEFYVESGNQYYIKADGYKKTVGSYSITIQSPQEGEPLWEEIDYSNKLKTADSITHLADEYGNIQIEAGIYPANDKDYFVFTVTQDANYSVNVNANGSPLDSKLAVYNQDKKLIAKNDDTSEYDTDSAVEFSAQQGDVIYIKATGWKKTLGTYSLTVSNLDVIEGENSQGENPSGNDTSNGNSGGIVDGEIPDYLNSSSGSTGWLLTITLSDYPGTRHDLAGPIHDAEVIKGIFTDYYYVPEQNVYEINTDVDVNEDTIEAGFEWLAENADADDYVFVYYSGHGYEGRHTEVDDNEGLLLPGNVIVYEEQLSSWISKIDSDASKVIVVDSCYAGGLSGVTQTNPNTMFVGSSEFSQVAWDEVSGYYPNSDYDNGGVFANWLDYGVFSGKADSNHNGFVGLLEAFNYAEINISKKTGTGRSSQDPVVNYSLDLDSMLFIG